MLSCIGRLSWHTRPNAPYVNGHNEHNDITDSANIWPQLNNVGQSNIYRKSLNNILIII